MRAACALRIFSGTIILNFGFQESLRTFLKPFFTRGGEDATPPFSILFSTNILEDVEKPRGGCIFLRKNVVK